MRFSNRQDRFYAAINLHARTMTCPSSMPLAPFLPGWRSGHLLAAFPFVT